MNRIRIARVRHAAAAAFGAGGIALAAPASAAGVDAAPDRWRLADLYASVDAWQADAAKLQAQLPSLARCRGRLGESARRLALCLDRSAELHRLHERLATYTLLLRDQDSGVASSTELDQRAERLGADLQEAAAFMRPELLELGAGRIDRFIAAEPRLAKHRHPLRTVLRSAPHTLDTAGEQLLATLAPAGNAGEAVYRMLVDADLRWPSVELGSGVEVTVDQPGYEKHRQSADRDDRRRVMQAFFGRWKEYERSFGVTFHEMLKRDAAYAKARRYPDSLARALDAENLPRTVIDTLLAEAQHGLPTLHRYLRLRARMLGVATPMEYHDLYPPLVQAAEAYPLERSRRLLLDALAPLGAAYVDEVRGGFGAGWMDVYPRPGKRAGAYAASAYGTHPYLLLNHNDDHEALTTLAHEWGHAMHSQLANRAQPYVTAEYGSFVAEIAAIVNELLLADHLLKAAASDDERLFHLGAALETLRGTFFRQAMFTEFERDVHARADRGEPIAGQTLSRLYLDLLRRHHGEADGVTRIDELYGIEWAYIPHFYMGFYVFQYATSIAAAAQFADALLAGEPGARERYLGLLAAGGSDDGHALVKAAGVDLATPAPYRALLARMNRLLDQIEALEARRPRR